MAVLGEVFVYDPAGGVSRFLERAEQGFARIGSLEELRGRVGLLIIGPDALSAEEAFGARLLSFAATGGRVICLEQEIPPAGSALPAPLRPTERFGGYAHPAALGTPI